jgi:hypothetical protein
MSERKDRFIVKAEDLIITRPGEAPPPVQNLDPDETGTDSEG